jgi:hypothetical protein
MALALLDVFPFAATAPGQVKFTESLRQGGIDPF